MVETAELLIERLQLVQPFSVHEDRTPALAVLPLTREGCPRRQP